MKIPAQLQRGVQYLAPKERLLVVETDSFVAGAVFQKVDSLWYCVETAPILGWMMGKSPQEIKVKLSKLRARWRFLANASTKEEGVDRSASEREAPEALAGQTTADPGHNNYLTGETGIGIRPPGPQPDLKGVKPLDTASCAVVTCPPLEAREKRGVPPACASFVPESSRDRSPSLDDLQTAPSQAS